MQAWKVHVQGVVQGVGFRPFIYYIATDLELTGSVHNAADGVHIWVEGREVDLEVFLHRMQNEAPLLARIDSVAVSKHRAKGCDAFTIIASEHKRTGFQPIAADATLCSDCQRELFDPADRRYHYPFINCTNCGPRYTIISGMPYDRPRTTMSAFEMCAECRTEYEDPLNRRFHAQPIACPACGPRVWLQDGFGLYHRDVIEIAVKRLKQGEILGIKGLGGFHLACSALNNNTVQQLRERKHRIDKPFALMMRDIEMVQKYCIINAVEQAQLKTLVRPIVLLEKRTDVELAEQLAPGQGTIGVMLPYTPLHLLLFETESPIPLVMTSGNQSGQPTIIDNEIAISQLGQIVDGFVLHDRDIQTRADDSVLRMVAGKPLSIRRSRGFAPKMLPVPRASETVLAVGAELKNTICYIHQARAILSQHIGDTKSLETMHALTETAEHLEYVFRLTPTSIAHDLHPDYQPTRYAQQRAQQDGIPLVAVQHHHAHIVACLADNQHRGDRPVIGIAFDGTGYGPDGTIWGGEVLVADYAGYIRVLHLKQTPLPGGNKAIRNIVRCAIGQLWTAEIEPFSVEVVRDALSERAYRIIGQQIEAGLNAPWTSSMGRLFDAAAFLIGVRQRVHYEGQAAIELEALADHRVTDSYPFTIANSAIDPTPLWHALVNDIAQGVSKPTMSAKFHNTVAQMVLQAARQAQQQTAVNEVALSGGVFQNVMLLRAAICLLEAAGFSVLTHRHVPPNDGGLALGQAVVAQTVIGG